MKNSQKNFEKIKENLVATYRNMAQNSGLQIDFDENLINNFFSWNQNIVNFQDEKLQSKIFSDLLIRKNFLTVLLLVFLQINLLPLNG